MTMMDDDVAIYMYMISPIGGAVFREALASPFKNHN